MNSLLLPVFNDPKRPSFERHIPVIALLLIAAGSYLILAQHGFGNDAGTYNLLYSFATLMFGADYDPARYHGALVAELLAGGAAFLGGDNASNTLSVAFAVGTLGLFYRLLFHWLGRAQVAFLATVALAVNPWFVLVATTTTDYVYGLFFALLGLWLWRRGWGPTAAVALAFSASARLAYAPIGLALLLYPLLRSQPRPWAEVLQNVLIYAVMTLLLYLPAMMANGFEWTYAWSSVPHDWTFMEHLARFIYKMIYLFGLPATVVIFFWKVVRLHLIMPVFMKRKDPVLWVMYFLMVYHAVLFWFAPFEISYLLPILLITLAFMARVSKVGQWLVAITLCFAAYNVVKVETLDIEYASADPAAPIEAVAAKPQLSLQKGVLWEDFATRAERQAYYTERHQQRMQALQRNSNLLK